MMIDYCDIIIYRKSGKTTRLKLTHKPTGLFVERSGMFHYSSLMEEILYVELNDLVNENGK